MWSNGVEVGKIVDLTDVWGGEFELKNAQVRSRIKKRTSLRLI